MGLSCGLIGVPSCGKTTIFNAITAAGASGYGTEMNRAVVNVPDQRINKLVEMYHPRKTVPSTLDVVDIPGLQTAQGEGRGSKLLGHIKDVEALLHVVRCFEDGSIPFAYETIDPVRDVETIDLELMAADSTTLQNKLVRLEKKVHANDKEAIRENEHCQKIYAAIQQGIPARKQKLTSQEMASVFECNLVSLKPVLYIANIKTMADADNKYVNALKQIAAAENAEVITVCGKDEADISQLAPEEQKEFLKDLGLAESSMERLMHAAYQNPGFD